MVTVKRKISSETERYGGFPDVEIKNFDNEIEIGDSFSQSEQKRAESSFEYSTPATINTNQEVTQQEVTAAPYMFDVRSSKPVAQEQKQVVTKQKLDGKTKLLLGVYLSVILVLSALVIATGMYLTSSGARVEAWQNELNVKNVVYNEQLNEIARLSDEDAIAGRAYNSGMEDIESSEVITLLPMEETQAYEGTTNWFDSFCDWLSGVVGG